MTYTEEASNIIENATEKGLSFKARRLIRDKATKIGKELDDRGDPHRPNELLTAIYLAIHGDDDVRAECFAARAVGQENFGEVALTFLETLPRQ